MGCEPLCWEPLSTVYICLCGFWLIFSLGAYKEESSLGAILKCNKKHVINLAFVVFGRIPREAVRKEISVQQSAVDKVDVSGVLGASRGQKESFLK